MTFTPLTRTGKSVPAMLIEFSKEKKIPTGVIDFELIDHQTYIQRPNEDYVSVGNIDDITEKDIRNSNTIIERGDLTAKEAYIDILESGKVTCSEYVHIKKMLGGKVVAPTVVVDELLSNGVIIASKLIEVTTILGKDNTLRIDPDSMQAYHDKLVPLEEQAAQIQKEIEEDEQQLMHLTQEHSSKVDRIKEFQKRVIIATKAGEQPMKQDIIRVKQFKKDSDLLKTKAELIANKKISLEEIKQELDVIYNQDLYGEIKVKTEFDGHSRVEFVNMQTKETISHVPEGKYDSISLELNANEEKVIKLL